MRRCIQFVREMDPISLPWQNGFAECVDHIIVLGEMHLRRILKSYAD